MNLLRYFIHVVNLLEIVSGVVGQRFSLSYFFLNLKQFVQKQSVFLHLFKSLNIR